MFSAEYTVVDTRPMVVHRSQLYLEMEALGNRIAEGAGNLNAATAVWLGQIAEFDRRGGWFTPGNARTCAHWLSWRCGLGLEAAREHVRVARALEELPLLRAEMAAGRLSYSKIRAVTRVANPNNEPGLVNLAKSSTGAQLERVVAGMRRAKSLDETPDPHEQRTLRWKWDKNGMLDIRGLFTPEQGALILAALAAMAPEVTVESDPDGEKRNLIPVPTVNADSMHAMAQFALDHLAITKPSSSPNYVVNIHAHLEDLTADPEDGEVAATEAAPERDVTYTGPRIENGPAIRPETLQRILCDSAAVVVAHHKKGRPGTSMDIGRRSRIVPFRLRRALIIRDKGCGAPGCTATKFLHAHHVIHWSRGGPTALWNLVLLCTAHHHLVHEGGWTVVADGHGGFIFRSPEGDLIEQVPNPTEGSAEAVLDMHDATIDDRTTIPNWHGENLDLHYVVEVLLLAERRAAEALADVSAETPEPAGPDLN